MITRFISLALALALVSTVGGPSALAATQSITDTPGSALTTGSGLSSVARKETKTDENLRAGLDKLLADAKAGKVAPAGLPQNRTVKRNNLSDGAKLAIGLGIVVALVVLVATYRRGRTYDRDLGCAVAGTC